MEGAEKVYTCTGRWEREGEREKERVRDVWVVYCKSQGVKIMDDANAMANTIAKS